MSVRVWASTVLMVLIAATVCAQAPYVGVEPRIMFRRTNISLEPWNGVHSFTAPAVSVLCRSGPLRARYDWMPPWSFSSTLDSPAGLVVNGTDFGSEKDAKPVSFDWKHSGLHRLEVSGAQGCLRPTVSYQWGRLSVDVTQQGDTPKTASQSWNLSRWAGGFTVINQQPGLTIELSVLGGNRYIRAQGLAVWAIATGCNMTAGLRWEESKYEDLTIRTTAPFIGVVAGW